LPLRAVGNRGWNALLRIGICQKPRNPPALAGSAVDEQEESKTKGHSKISENEQEPQVEVDFERIQRHGHQHRLEHHFAHRFPPLAEPLPPKIKKML